MLLETAEDLAAAKWGLRRHSNLANLRFRNEDQLVNAELQVVEPWVVNQRAAAESVFCVATSEKSISGATVNSEQVGLDTHVTTKSSPNMAPSSATTAALGAAAGPHTRQERLSAALQAGQAEPGAARSKAISEAVQAQSGAARSQAISEAISDQVQKEIDAQMVSHI